jgi:hypothetical protein
VFQKESGELREDKFFNQFLEIKNSVNMSAIEKC